ncbi:MAG: hypothetical protein ACLQQ4_07335 [Bacteroidia bacterium]
MTPFSVEVRSKFFILIVFFALILAANSCENKEALVPIVNSLPAGCDTAGQKYSKGIDTIINTQCAVSGCHAYGGLGADFTTYSGVLTYAKGGQGSSMWQDLVGPTSTPMPQIQQPGWNECDKFKLEDWILAGAPN